MTQWTPEQVKLLTTFHREHAPRLGELVTLGYTEPDAQQRLDAFMARPDTGLVDIRYSPRSRWRPEFNQAALIERYGALRYGHCKALGNVNYNKPGEPIKLSDPFMGTRMVIHLLQGGRSLILLCACKDYERCHRKTAYDLIVSALTSTGTTLFTVKLDPVTKNYRAQWLLPGHEDTQWFHVRSLTGPTSEEAKQDVLRVEHNALYMQPEHFANIPSSEG